MKKFKMQTPLYATAFFSILLFLSSCSTSYQGIRKETTYIQFDKDDYEISSQLSGEATEIRLFGIDFARLFKKTSGNFDANGYAAIVNVPIVSTLAYSPKRAQQYALYNLLKYQSGYDVVIYPRFETKSSGIPFIYRVTTAKVTARLGRLKN